MDAQGMEPLPKPTELGPLARDQFVTGFEAAMRADPQPDADAQVGHNAVAGADAAHPLAFHLAGHPMYRALLAARYHFGAQERAFQNFMFRFCALVDLAKTNALRDWVKPTAEGDDQDIHPAVIYACADVRLTEDGRFPVDEFLHRTQQIAEQECHGMDG